MRLNLVCTVSLLLNVALAGYWLKNRPDSASFPIPSQPPQPAAVSRASNVSPAATKTAPVVAPPSVTPWSRIESTDLPAFIARLRAVGCPERTIRDLVVPEIERLYAGPEASPPDADDFWRPRQPSETLWRSRRLAQLQREIDRRDHIRALLGVDGTWPNAHGRSLEEWAGLCGLLTPPSFEAAEQFAWLIERTRFERERIETLAEEPLKFSEIDDLKRLRDGAFSQAVSLVGRARVDEALGLVRTVMGAFEVLDFFDSEDPKVRLPEAEMRRLVAAQAKDMAIVDEIFDFEAVTQLERFRAGLPKDADAEKKAAFLSSLVPALGEVRAREVALRSLPDWSQLAEFAQEHNLPESTAALLAEARELATAEARRIRETPVLTAEDEMERLQQIGEELRASLGETLPPDAWSSYLEEHGDWIQSLENGEGDDD
jgi:hypothetical protein